MDHVIRWFIYSSIHRQVLLWGASMQVRDAVLPSIMRLVFVYKKITSLVCLHGDRDI